VNVFQGIIFDFDDTLVHARGGWHEIIDEGTQAMVAYLEAQGMPLPRVTFIPKWLEARQFAATKSEREQEEHTADDTLNFLVQFFGYIHADRATIERAVDQFYAPEIAAKVLYPDALETVAALKGRGYKVALLGNAPCDRNVQVQVDRLGLRPYLHPVLTSETIEDRKPKVEAYHKVLEIWDVQAHEAIMVGNSLAHDILGAKNAGLWSIWVDRGDQPNQLTRAIQADARVESLRELLAVIARWEAGQ